MEELPSPDKLLEELFLTSKRLSCKDVEILPADSLKETAWHQVTYDQDVLAIHESAKLLAEIAGLSSLTRVRIGYAYQAPWASKRDSRVINPAEERICIELRDDQLQMDFDIYESGDNSFGISKSTTTIEENDSVTLFSIFDAVVTLDIETNSGVRDVSLFEFMALQNLVSNLGSKAQ